jgi:hypothetical protein
MRASTSEEMIPPCPILRLTVRERQRDVGRSGKFAPGGPGSIPHIVARSAWPCTLTSVQVCCVRLPGTAEPPSPPSLRQGKCPPLRLAYSRRRAPSSQLGLPNEGSAPIGARMREKNASGM